MGKKNRTQGMEFAIQDYTILLAMSGSRCYGIHTPESDIDVKGFAIPPKRYIYGVKNFDQVDNQKHIETSFKDLFKGEEAKIIERTKLEGSVYEIRKGIELATACNPNIIDTIFCRDQDLRLITPAGLLLRDARQAFISAKAKYRFSGYAIHQLRRINTHRKWLIDPPKAPPERADFALGAEPELGRDQMNTALAAIQKRLDSWEVDYGDLDDAEIVYIQSQIRNYLAEIMCTTDRDERANKRWLSAGRVLGFGDNFLELLDKERRYENVKKNWTSYQKWKSERNAERATLESKFGYDTKHAAHLFRLMTMCREIITTGEVHVWRGDIDREQIMEVRNGHWSYERVVEFAAKEDEELEKIIINKEFKVPRKPNMKVIEDLTMTLLDMALTNPQEAYRIIQ